MNDRQAFAVIFWTDGEVSAEPGLGFNEDHIDAMFAALEAVRETLETRRRAA